MRQVRRRGEKIERGGERNKRESGKLRRREKGIRNDTKSKSS